MRPRLVSWIKFHTVGLLGMFVQLCILTVLKSGFGMNVLKATALAVECAVLHNFVWHERWTWAHRRLDVGKVLGRLLRFNASNGLISLAGNVMIMWLLATKLEMNFLVANLAAIGACSVLNFLVSDRVVFRSQLPS